MYFTSLLLFRHLLQNNIIEIKNILRLAMKKSMTIDFFIAIFYSYREVDCPDSWILNPYKKQVSFTLAF